MPGSHGHRGVLGATRTPAGSMARASYDQPAKRTSSLWPGWTDDPEGRCECSWSYKDGVRQVKMPNTACPVRHSRVT